MVSAMPEPRELRPYQTFDQSFASRGAGDFRPEVIEVASHEPMTEDGFGGPPPPRATHPSLGEPAETAAAAMCVCGEVEVGDSWVQIGSSVHLATSPCYVAADPAAETAQEPAGFDASAPNPASPAPEVPDFSLGADAAALSELL